MLFPVYRGSHDNILILHEEYKIKGVTIPIGTRSDGMTLKNRFLRLIINKYEPRFSPFFFLHDYLCQEERYKEADRIGRLILLELEDTWRTRTALWAIETYHRYEYGV